ncbi:patatin-like phospholipase family protein [Vibrio owensii]|uniref:patatin-like phospholipase family protein n=1 Tax=Vibrio harveyi group TaxID=717610 RepID=UPI003CC58C64
MNSQSTDFKVGLALSGGGVKGIAHLGVLKYLDEIGIPVDIIAGTSAGALVGSLYAAGLSAQQIFDNFMSLGVTSLKLWGSNGLLNTEKMAPIIREQISKAGKLDSFADFERELFVVATNMNTGTEAVFSRGSQVSVTKAVTASASFPQVFSPVEIDGDIYSDGGITNHFPVDLIESRVDYLIGVFVTPHGKMSNRELKFPGAIGLRALMLQGIASEAKKLNNCDLAIVSEELSEYNTFTLSTSSIKKIFMIGYEAAKAHESEILKLKSICENNRG